MDATNYITVSLTKPMGVVFEENESDIGGIFVQSLKPDGAAFVNGRLQVGDQLVAVNTKKVSGLTFDEALNAIVEADTPQVQLTVFRGKASYLYGPTGASRDWLDQFIASQNSNEQVKSG
jgi:C-terminal processing protease CtpA/Prc